jgi:hypothetical protein
MTIDARLSSMKSAQLRPATELASRNWPPLTFSEVLPYPGHRAFIAHIEIEGGEELSFGFTLPFDIDCEDGSKLRRLNETFFGGLKLEHAASTSCEPR